jgi:hypothetical protein
MRSLMRVWTGLEITCLHYPLPGIAPTQERAGGNLRRGRLKARGEVYHRIDLAVNQFVASGRRFSKAIGVEMCRQHLTAIGARRMPVAGNHREKTCPRYRVWAEHP